MRIIPSLAAQLESKSPILHSKSRAARLLGGRTNERTNERSTDTLTANEDRHISRGCHDGKEKQFAPPEKEVRVEQELELTTLLPQHIMQKGERGYDKDKRGLGIQISPKPDKTFYDRPKIRQGHEDNF